MREIVFAHIPKTAGTSLRNGLVDAFPDHFHLFDYGEKSPSTTVEFADVIYKNPKLKGLRDRLPGDRGTFVSGHFPTRKYWSVFHPSAFIVFVRNPVDRLFSEYTHLVRNYRFEKNIETFVETKRSCNVLLKYLNVELSKVGFIGDSDRYNESISVLSKRLGCRIKKRKDNKGSGKYREFLSDSHLMARVKRLNSDDIDFHRYLIDEAIPNNWARNNTFISAARITGSVIQTSPGQIDGVAFDMEGRELVTVDVSAGNRKVLSVVADRYDEQLHQNKRIVSGIGGFSITRETLQQAGLNQSNGASVSFTVRGRHLHGSPIVIE